VSPTGRFATAYLTSFFHLNTYGVKSYIILIWTHTSAKLFPAPQRTKVAHHTAVPRHRVLRWV
jgi:hypothetical protein